VTDVCERDPVGAAYDAIAASYDAQLAGDSWMRAVLWRQLAQTFGRGDRVLDCGCGSGLDAQFLAGLGVMVTAIDASAAMVERTSLRSTAGSGDIHAEVLDIGQIGMRFQRGEFDGIISCFGSLNTQPSLGTFAADASELLKPGGRMIVHILNGWSLWEWASLLSRGKWKAARALGRHRERDFEIGGVTVTHFLENPGEEYTKYFDGQFRLRNIYGLGIFRPPAPRSLFRPRVLDILERADILAGKYRPLRGWGRFTVLQLEKSRR